MNNIFKKFSFPPKAFLVAIFFSLAFFLLGIQKIKTYQSQMTIFIIPKSTNAIAQQEKILANIIHLPETLSFYDRLLKDNPSFEDSSAGESAAKRKAIWNKMSSIKKISQEGSIISISISIDSKADSNFIISRVTRTLFDLTSAYYDVKNDIDLRAVDGPITRTIFPGWQWLLLASVIFGMLVSLVIDKKTVLFKRKTSTLQDIFKNNPLKNLANLKNDSQAMPIEALENFYEKEVEQSDQFQAENFKKVQEKEPVDQLIITEQADVDHNVAEEPENLKAIMNRFVYPNFPEMPTHKIEESFAPDNLPIGDFETETLLEADSERQTTIEKKTHEPTAEELKNRLNQLLKGDI
ncbi:MAG: hypothetical protein HGA61_03070 [Candidatus Moranbacteria bacterium]|nr:hypothetical protein [Candidatus Moranbacteria bacterium]